MLVFETDFDCMKGNGYGSNSVGVVAAFGFTVEAKYRRLHGSNGCQKMIAVAFECDVIEIVTDAYITKVGEVPCSGQTRVQVKGAMQGVDVDAEEAANGR